MYLLAANGGLKIKLRDGAEMPLAETCKNVEAHMKLDESSLMTRIEDSEIVPAQEILQRIWSRSLYHKLITLDISKTSTTCPAALRETDETTVLQDFLSKSGVGDNLKGDFTAFKTTINTGMSGQKVITICSQKDAKGRGITNCRIPFQIYVYSKPEDDTSPVSVRPMDTQQLFGTKLCWISILLKNNAILREAETLIHKWKDSWKIVQN